MNPFDFVNANKRFRFFSWFLGLFSVCLMGAAIPKTLVNKQQKLHPEIKSVVVMELFTSQGCSSCPPADALLGKYATASSQEIIPLSFHVDYWNRLGWSDPFSQSVYSQRQEWYRDRIPGSSVYTPQLVIDGKFELVGSNRAAIETLVQKEWSETKPGSIQLRKIMLENDKIHFQYEAVNPSEILNIALIEKKVTTSVHAGENEGLRLLNYNIVRSFHSQTAARNGEGEVSLPRDFKADEYALVVYTQGKIKTNISSAVYMDLASLEK